MGQPYIPESLQSVSGVSFGFCCEKSRTRLITMSASYPDDGENQWLAVDGDDVVDDIIYCPFCGVKLPTDTFTIVMRMNEG